MKKIISLKNKKLTESSIKVGDVNYANRLRKRVTDVARALELAKEALKKAEANGQTSLAAQLKEKIAELETLLTTYNQDELEKEASGYSSADSSASGDRNKGGSNNSKKVPEEEDAKAEDENGEEGEDEDGEAGNSNDDGDEEEEDNDGEGNGEGEEEEDDEEGEDGDDNGDGEDEGQNKDKDDDSEEKGQEPGQDPDEDTEDTDGNEPGQDPDKDDKDTEGDEPGSDPDDDDEGGGDPGDDPEEPPVDPDKPTKGKGKGGDGTESDKDDSDSEDRDDSDSDEDDDDEEKETDKSKSKLSLDDDDESGGGDDDDPILNPFADEEDVPSMPPRMNGFGGKPPREATADETIELLKTLTGEGKLGAIDALKDLIAKRKAAANESLKSTAKKPLTEAVKGLRDMTDDEFGEYINNTYDLIDKADPVTYIDDMDDRAARIKDWSSDPLSIQELQAEDNVELQKDYQKAKARDAAKARYNNYGSLRDFEMNFYSAINNQIEEVRVEYQSYDEINAEYESEDAIMKADIVKELPNEAKPIIDVFFDQSGSWDKKDVKVGRKAIKSVKTFEDQGDIVLNLRFFDDVVTADEDDPRLGAGGTGAWPYILQEIKANGAKNVVIMTDRDMNYDSVRNGQTCRVEGCVWWIWKNGESAPNCKKHLIGEKGNYEFAFMSANEKVDDEE